MAIPAPRSITGDPLPAVPCELAELLRAQLEDIADEVEQEVRAKVPEYARPTDETYRTTLRAGVVQALTLFVDLIADPLRDWDSIAATYYEIGRGEAMEHRSLDALQSALRIGGRAAWRRMGQYAEKLGLDSATLTALGEAAFTTIHEVAEAATAGYLAARQRSAGELQRCRKRLLDLLLCDPPAPEESVRDLAHTAQWPVPRQVAVIVLAAAPEESREPREPGKLGEDGERSLAPAEVLVDMGTRPPRMVIPDPDGTGRFRSRNLALALRGRPAAVGPTVPLGRATDSLRWATQALLLMGRGILPRQEVVWCAEHLSTLLLYSDEGLVRMLSQRVLAPMDTVATAKRSRLAETLLAWLQSGSSVSEVAARLHVHPQTVRYRLRQLEKFFGDQLHDPRHRFDLELALQAESLGRTS